MEQILSTDSLTMHFDELLVLENLSFAVTEGEVVTLLGPSGCGKSTILHIISGLLVPERGRVLMRGREITGETGRMSYMQQKDLLLPWLKVIDNVALPLRISGVGKRTARERAAAHFDAFGIEGFEHAYPSQLSGGMRQRAALLRTYLFSKEVLLLDEPFARVDAVTRRKLHGWFVDVLERLECSVLFVTHDIDEAMKLSNRIYVLSARPARVLKEIRVDRRDDADLKNEIISLLEKM